MAQFVLVANGVNNVEFERAMEIQIRSKTKIKFVPQGVQNQVGAVLSQPMNATNNIINHVRFEWDHEGHEFGAELVSALAGHHKHHAPQAVEPAA